MIEQFEKDVRHRNVKYQQVNLIVMEVGVIFFLVILVDRFTFEINVN